MCKVFAEAKDSALKEFCNLIAEDFGDHTYFKSMKFVADSLQTSI